MKPTILLLAVALPTTATTDGHLDVPLKWKLQRWEFVAIVEAGDTAAIANYPYTKYVEKKIVRVLRGRREDFPEFEFYRNNDLQKARSYLFCYYKSPPGSSGWEHFSVDRTNASFMVKAILPNKDAGFYDKDAVYSDVHLEEFEKLLKDIPFESNPTNTLFYQNGMTRRT